MFEGLVKRAGLPSIHHFTLHVYATAGNTVGCVSQSTINHPNRGYRLPIQGHRNWSAGPVAAGPLFGQPTCTQTFWRVVLMYFTSRVCSEGSRPKDFCAGVEASMLCHLKEILVEV